MQVSMFDSYTLKVQFPECSKKLKEIKVDERSEIACFAISTEDQKQGPVLECDRGSIAEAFPSSKKHCLAGAAVEKYFTTKAEDICKLVGAMDDHYVSIFVCTQSNSIDAFLESF